MTKVRDLNKGDILADSGFQIMQKPYSKPNLGNKIVVIGKYPNEHFIKLRLWNPDNIVEVQNG